METRNEVCEPRFCVAQWRASRRSARTRSLLLVLAPLGAILMFSGVSAQAQTGCCFVWNNNGEADCVADQTADQCVAVSGWQNVYFIEGGTCEDAEGQPSDNGLPVRYVGDARWRYVVMAGETHQDPEAPPGVTEPGCRCVDNKCEEWHEVLMCWMDHPDADPREHN